MDGISGGSKRPQDLRQDPEPPPQSKRTRPEATGKKQLKKTSPDSRQGSSVRSRRTAVASRTAIIDRPFLPDHGNNCFINTSLHFLSRIFPDDLPKQLWLCATIPHPASQVACSLINLVACMKRLRTGELGSEAQLPQYQLEFLQACQNFACQRHGGPVELQEEYPLLPPTPEDFEAVENHGQTITAAHASQMRYLLSPAPARRSAQQPPFSLNQNDPHEFITVLLELVGLSNNSDFHIRERDILTSQWQDQPLSRTTDWVSSPFLSLPVSDCQDLGQSLARHTLREDTDLPLDWQVTVPAGELQERTLPSQRRTEYSTAEGSQGIIIQLDCYLGQSEYLRAQATSLLKASPDPLVLPLPDETHLKLDSLICHRGQSLNAGHYQVVERKNGEWVVIDDFNQSAVTAPNLDQALRKAGTPYLLYYRLTEPTEPMDTQPPPVVTPTVVQQPSSGQSDSPLDSLLKRFAENNLKSVNNRMNDQRGRARKEFPIPSLPGLRTDIKGWNNDLARYVCQQQGISLGGRPLKQTPEALCGLRVLDPASPEYLVTLKTFARQCFTDVPSIPHLCRRLNFFNVPVPAIAGLPDSPAGSWNIEITAVALVQAGLSLENALDPDPLVNEIIDAIQKQQNVAVLDRRYRRETPGGGPSVHPGYEPRTESDFKPGINEWSLSMIRYLAHKHRAVIESRLERPLPESWSLTTQDKLNLYPHSHPEYSNWVADRVTEMSGKSMHTIANFLSSHNVIIPDTPVTADCRGTSNWTFPTLVAYCDYINVFMESRTSGYAEMLQMMKSDKVDNVCARLNKLMTIDEAFAPPQMMSIRPELTRWTAPLVRVVLEEESVVPQDELGEQLKVSDLDYLKTFRADTDEYVIHMEFLLMQWVTVERLGFHEVLRRLNRIDSLGRNFHYEIPGHPLIDSQRHGQQPWTESDLMAVLNVYGLHPDNHGSEAVDLVFRYIQDKNIPRNACQILNRRGYAMPESIKEYLVNPDQADFTLPLIRLLTFIHIARDPQAQRQVRPQYRIKTADIKKLCKSELQQTLLHQAGFKT